MSVLLSNHSPIIWLNRFNSQIWGVPFHLQNWVHRETSLTFQKHYVWYCMFGNNDRYHGSLINLESLSITSTDIRRRCLIKRNFFRTHFSYSTCLLTSLISCRLRKKHFLHFNACLQQIDQNIKVHYFADTISDEMINEVIRKSLAWFVNQCN